MLLFIILIMMLFSSITCMYVYYEEYSRNILRLILTALGLVEYDSYCYMYGNITNKSVIVICKFYYLEGS